jgi:hypothetical protein
MRREKDGEHKGLLDTLLNCFDQGRESRRSDTSISGLDQGCSCITVKMECHDTLLDTLVVHPSAKHPTVPRRSFQGSRAENREIMARHPGVLDYLD